MFIFYTNPVYKRFFNFQRLFLITVELSAWK